MRPERGGVTSLRRASMRSQPSQPVLKSPLPSPEPVTQTATAVPESSS
ncbi:MAG: hypothetical protein ACPGVO_17230 [Spirulinaceae cyanobacterium]